jgi:hypothetical protein
LDAGLYDLKSIPPEKLNDIRSNLLAYWDVNYPLSKYPPPKNYKNSRTPTHSTRVVKKDQFRTTMPCVLDLVNIFQGIYGHLEIELVWFIRKSRRGDGFQRWHRDLVGTANIVATIVVNIGLVSKEDSQGFHIPTDDDLFPRYIAGNVVLPPRGIKDAEGVGLCSQVFKYVVC